MRNFTGIAALVLFILPSVAFGAELGLSTTTLFRFEERAVPELPKRSVFPATQFVDGRVGALADGNLSFHISGWGRVDLADNSTNGKSTEGDLTYGYLLYSFPKANGEIKAGRFFTYEAGTVEQVDGVSGRVNLQHGFTAYAFGGKPVRSDDIKDNKGNFIGGGRMAYRYGGMLDIGLSALHEDGAWTRSYVPGTGVLQTVRKYRELAGADVWIAPTSYVEFSGRTSYDTVIEQLADQNYLLTLRPFKSLSLTGEYGEQKLESFFSGSSVPLTLFVPVEGSRIRTLGAVATYSIIKPLEVSAEYRQIKYRNGNHGDSKRYGFNARMIVSERIRIGAGYHRLDSETAAMNSYDEYRCYGTYDSGSFFASADIVAHAFKEPIYGKDTAFEATVAAGYRVTPEVAVSGNVSYGKNPLLTSETRGVVKLNYNYETKGAR